MLCKIIICLYVVLASLNISCTTAKSILGSAIPVCDAKSPAVSECVKGSTNKMIPRLKKGIREFDLPPIDPMNIPRMDIGQESGAVYLKLELSNTVHTGLSNVVAEDVKIDMNNLVWTFNFFVPEYSVTGDYNGKGRILLLPLGGVGIANFTFKDMRMGFVLSGSKKVVDGQEYYNLKNAKVSVNFSPGKNILDIQRKQGDMRLAESMRTFLKDNADEVFNSMKETLESIYGEMIMGLLQKMFNKVPLNKLFKNI